MSDVVFGPAVCSLSPLCKKLLSRLYLFESCEEHCFNFLFLHFELIYYTVEGKDSLSFTQDSSVVPMEKE